MNKLLIVLLILSPFLSFSQLGGNSVFEFVNTPSSARENALGNNIISLKNSDVALALKNPAILDSSCNNKFSGTWGSYHVKQTEIGLGSFGYGHSINNKISIMGGLHFLNYGKFIGYDEFGNQTESFLASDYEFIVGGSYRFFNNFTAGISIKPILSYIEKFSSYAILTDVGVNYTSNDQLFSSSFILRNAGVQLKSYSPGNYESSPLSVDFGITQKLRHAPFRFSVTYSDLQKFNLSYVNTIEEESKLINEAEQKKETFFDVVQENLMKHITLSSEILLHKNFNALVGYTNRRSQEMSFGTTKKAVGFSLGFSLQFSQFSLTYGWSKQHVAGGLNFFSLNTDINKLYSKINKPNQQ